MATIRRTIGCPFTYLSFAFQKQWKPKNERYLKGHAVGTQRRNEEPTKLICVAKTWEKQSLWFVFFISTVWSFDSS